VTPYACGHILLINNYQLSQASKYTDHDEH